MKPIRLYNRSAIEIDLRKEVQDFFFGSGVEIPKGQLHVLRFMRRKDGISIPTRESDIYTCECKTSPDNEPEIDYRCDICDGEGYLFDDEVITCYKTSRFNYQDIEKYQPFGKSTISMSFFYTLYNRPISRFDKLLEVVTDTEGRIVSPTKILKRNNIHMAERFRADNGRVEYHRLSCFSE